MEAQELLKGCGLSATANRLLVLHALSGAGQPQTPQELLAALAGRMNRVTLYRILDLLVEHGVAARHSAGGRAYCYCLGQGLHGHSHFHCTRCGQTQCLDSRLLEPGLSRILSGLPMRVDLAEVSLGGLCENCQNA
jgi:Fur family transcriptional regulator, ferric uptake regulator